MTLSHGHFFSSIWFRKEKKIPTFRFLWPSSTSYFQIWLYVTICSIELHLFFWIQRCVIPNISTTFRSCKSIFITISSYLRVKFSKILVAHKNIVKEDIIYRTSNYVMKIKVILATPLEYRISCSLKNAIHFSTFEHLL
jgi:hypothetical protein